MLDEKQFAQLLFQMTRIADSLHVLAQANQQEPNYVKAIGEYKGFDWESIGATIVKRDLDGPTHVEWGGAIWLRRSPQNKYGPVIFFSRSAGKDEDGNNRYLRLITFKEISDVDPIADKARQKAGNGRRERRPSTSKANDARSDNGFYPPDIEAELKAVTGEQPETSTGEVDEYFEIRPRSPKDATTFYTKSVQAFVDEYGKPITHDQAIDIMESVGLNAVEAFQILINRFKIVEK